MGFFDDAAGCRDDPRLVDSEYGDQTVSAQVVGSEGSVLRPAFDLDTAGMSKAISRPTMEITTSNSMSVNACRKRCIGRTRGL